MDQNRFTGTARDMAGRAQEAVGSMVGDAKTQMQGRMNQVAGQAQDAAGQAADMIRDQPFLAVLIAAGVGYLIGRLTG